MRDGMRITLAAILQAPEAWRYLMIERLLVAARLEQ
jgi:hypothetical protein